jgi:hypothetical protein
MLEKFWELAVLSSNYGTGTQWEEGEREQFWELEQLFRLTGAKATLRIKSIIKWKKEEIEQFWELDQFLSDKKGNSSNAWN